MKISSNAVALVAASCLATPLAGCYTIKYEVPQAQLTQDTTVSLGGTGTRYLRHVSKEERAWFIGGGLMQFAGPKPDRMLFDLSEGRKLANVKFKSEATFWDGLAWFGSAIVVGLVLNGVSGAVAGGNATSVAVVSYINPIASLLLIPQFRTITVEGDLVD